MKSKFQKKAKRISLVLFFTLLFVAVVGQIVPIEFAKTSTSSSWRLLLLVGIPISILFTLSWTIHQSMKWVEILATIVLTIAISSIGFFSLLYFMFSPFGGWISEEIVYENIQNPSITIHSQIWDLGAFGYDQNKRRIVKIEPFLGNWNMVKAIDTNQINHSEWKVVHQQGDIKWP